MRLSVDVTFVTCSMCLVAWSVGGYDSFIGTVLSILQWVFLLLLAAIGLRTLHNLQGKIVVTTACVILMFTPSLAVVGISAERVGQFIRFTVAAWIFIVASSDEKFGRSCFNSIFFVGLVHTILGFALAMLLPTVAYYDSGVRNQLQGLTWHPNIFGFEVLTVIVYALCLKCRSEWGAIFKWIIIVACCPAIYLADSRSSVMGGLVALAFFGTFRLARHRFRLLSAWVVTLLFSLILLVQSLPTIIALNQDLLLSTPSSLAYSNSNDERLIAWKASVVRIENSPIFGDGFLQPFQVSRDVHYVLLYSHNFFLTYTAGTGLLGMVFVGIVIAFSFRMVNMLFTGPGEAVLFNFEARAAAALVMVSLFLSAIEGNLQGVWALDIPFAISLGYLLYWNRSTEVPTIGSPMSSKPTVRREGCFSYK